MTLEEAVRAIVAATPQKAAAPKPQEAPQNVQRPGSLPKQQPRERGLLEWLWS